MRRNILALALVIPLLGGCSSLGAVVGVTSGSVATVAPQTVADAEKALTVAHLAYNAVSLNLLDATKSGLLHGTNAATAKVYYDQAGAALDAADAADRLTNAQGIMAKVTEAEGLIVQIQTLVKG